MTTDLKPCPFCGGAAEFCNTDEVAQLRCEGCGALSGICFFSQEECETGIGTATEARVAEAWNRRAGPAPKAGDAVPEGWQLVPKEPTPEMRACAMRLLMDGPYIYENADGALTFETVLAPYLWDAMLAAAPAAATEREK